MRRCAQSSQRSTCPPSAAVRQRSIADMTLSWPRLTWPAWDARQAGPRWRKMSATSTAGRDNGRASTGHHLAERVDGDASVECRRVELLVSEQHLDDADIGLLFQKMGGKAVPQGVNTGTLGNAGALGCHANEPVELAPTHVLSPVAGEQPGLAGMHPSLLARGAPPFTQYIEQVGRENDVAILVALALLDADHHSVAVDVGELQRYDLR